MFYKAEYVWSVLKKKKRKKPSPNDNNKRKKKRNKPSASPVVMMDMPVFASFIEPEWNTIVRS